MLCVFFSPVLSVYFAHREKKVLYGSVRIVDLYQPVHIDILIRVLVRNF